MQKILYIHGLHSNPNPDKVKILQGFGLDIIAPYIDYEKEKGKVYARIINLAIKEQIDLIIGSSMGGFIGYWLGKELEKPALLFNPALYFPSLIDYIPNMDASKDAPLYICLGEKDERVDPSEVRQYLSKDNASLHHIKIVTASWLHHGIDLRTFKSISAWFLAEEAL